MHEKVFLQLFKPPVATYFDEDRNSELLPNVVCV